MLVNGHVTCHTFPFIPTLPLPPLPPPPPSDLNTQVGSGSAAGAGSPIMRDAVERITHALLSIPNANTAAAAAKNNNNNKESSSKSLSVAATEKEASLTSLEKSFILSADMAHAVKTTEFLIE